MSETPPSPSLSQGKSGRTQKRQLWLFLGAVVCITSGMGVHDSIFNNFLSDTFSLSANARGWLELPRELPGFLVFVTAGALASLPITRVGMVGALAMAAGMLGMSLFGHVYAAMMAMMILASAGMHILQPVGTTVILSLGDERARGKRMGLTGAVDTIGSVLGTGLVWLTFDRVTPPYRAGFVCAGAAVLVAAILYRSMHIPSLHKPRARMVVRGKYWLYYTLELFFGARKQIFITFGPWVLIKVYGTDAASIAGLLMTASLIGIVFKPLAGVAIDRFGERTIMIIDGIVLVFACIGYGYALELTGDPDRARLLASACFILDNLLFALGSCRAIYASRLADDPQDLSSTLAMGVSINHIVSMTIPVAAGALWMGFGYQRVFLCAAFLALGNALFALLVPGKRAHA